MAISNGILLNGISGHIGKQLVIKQYAGKTVVTKFPDMSKRKLSKAQKKVNETMADANYAAKGIIRDPKLRNEAQIRLNVTSNKLYTALIKEYFANAGETDKKGRKK